ncbi:Concanavalin A-like lectin/glucanases superfamily protein [uncultured archaeon]|nr:Concanavalin A-like lectin/glucanases superfamily protein [uncultured archaeon]
MFNSKMRAQGSIEYLVAVSFVVVISLAVVTVLANQSLVGETISSSTNKLTVLSWDIGLSDSIADSAGKLFLVLQNNTSEGASVTKITVDNTEFDYSDIVSLGNKKSFLADGVAACSDKSRVYNIKINYTSADSVPHIEYLGDVRVSCTDSATGAGDFAQQISSIILQLKAKYYELDSDFSGGTFTSTKLAGSNSGITLDGNVLAIHPTNLVAYWQLNGSTADSSSSGINGTWSGGASYADGIFNRQGANFNGSRYISSATINLPTGASPRTVAAWFKANSLGSAGLVTYGAYVDHQEFGLQLQNSHLFFWGHGDDYEASTTTLRTGAWYHAAATFDGTTVLLYLNGRLEGTYTPSLNTVASTLRIGSGSAQEGDYFNGLIADAAIWNAALSAEDINSLYTQTGAEYVSQVFDANSSASFVSLKFNSSAAGGQNFGSEINPLLETSFSSGLVALWHFNNSAADASANLNDATMQGGSYDTGLWGTNAASLNGSSDYIEVPNNVMNNVSAGTISAWVNLNDVSEETIFSREHYGVDSMAIFAVGVGCVGSASGKICFHSINNQGEVLSSSAISANGWHNVVVAFDTSSASIYIDGALDSTASGNFSITDDAGGVPLIGAWASYGRYFNGKIDEFAVWNRKLSADEVKSLFDKGASTLGVKYKSCSNATTCAGDYSSTTTAADTNIDISGLTHNRYFQFAVDPSLVLFADQIIPAGCNGTPNSTSCATNYGQSNDLCSANSYHNGLCQWVDGSCADTNCSGSSSACTASFGCASTWVGDQTCVGTLTTSNQTDSSACTLIGGSWSQNESFCAGTASDCSTFGSTASCNNQSGCSASTSDCSGLDESSCNSHNSDCTASYSGGTYSCSGMDEGTCGSTSGCWGEYGSYSCSGMDESSCNNNSGAGCSPSYSGGGSGSCEILDESSCNANNQYGCQTNYSNSSGYCGGMDQGTCSSLGFAGCSWDGGSSPSCSGTVNDCSVRNDGSSSYCTDGHPECSWVSAVCSGNSGCESYGGEADCTADPNMYGSCSWSTPGMISGACANNTTDCHTWDSDSMSCGNAGCGYDSGSIGMGCSGNYSYNSYSGCSGSYTINPTYSGCSGSYGSYYTGCGGTYTVSNYFTGCSGNYFMGCSGNSTACISVWDSASCNALSGCGWSTGSYYCSGSTMLGCTDLATGKCVGSSPSCSGQDQAGCTAYSGEGCTWIGCSDYSSWNNDCAYTDSRNCTDSRCAGNQSACTAALGCNSTWTQGCVNSGETGLSCGNESAQQTCTGDSALSGCSWSAAGSVLGHLFPTASPILRDLNLTYIN